MIKRIRESQSILIISFVMVFLYFGINNHYQLSPDSYDVLLNDGSWRWMLYGNGRIVNAVIYYILEALGVSAAFKYFLSFGVAMLCLTMAITLLALEICSYIPNRTAIPCIIAFFSIVNPFIVEYFLFVEEGLFMMAILCNVAAFSMMLQYIRVQKKKYLFYTFLLLLFAVFIYQTSLALFVILCLPFIFHEAKSIKEFLKNTMLTALMYAVNLTVSYLITVGLLHTERVSAEKNLFVSILERLPHIFSKWYAAITSSKEMFSPVILPLSTGIILLCLLIRAFSDVPDKKGCICKLAGIAFVFAGTVFTGLFPWLCGMAECSAYRLIYPSACIGGSMIILFVLWNEFNEHKILCGILSITVASLLVVQYIGFYSFFIDRYACNKADLLYAREIQYEVNSYEQSTGESIRFIAVYPDASMSGTYPQSNGIVGTMAISEDWSNVNFINYYLGTAYEKAEQQETYLQFFAQQNWNVYSPEQLVFEGDTLHLCAY